MGQEISSRHILLKHFHFKANEITSVKRICEECYPTEDVCFHTKDGAIITNCSFGIQTLNKIFVCKSFQLGAIRQGQESKKYCKVLYNSCFDLEGLTRPLFFISYYAKFMNFCCVS